MSSGGPLPGRARAVAGFVHNVIAHPLLFFTGSAAWVIWLHDWSARVAWPQRPIRPSPYPPTGQGGAA